MVLILQRELTISIFGQKKDLELSDTADGCVGMIPVFSTLEYAKQYSDKPNVEIKEVVFKEEKGGAN